MVYSTFLHGLKEANESAAKATSLEATLPPTLASYQLRILPAYVQSATLFSRLLSSGLVPTEHRQTVVTKWKKILERAEKVRGTVERMGGDVAAASSSKGLLDQGSAAVQAKTEKDDAAQALHVLRQSSQVNDVHVPLISDVDHQAVLFQHAAPLPPMSDQQLAYGAKWTTALPEAGQASGSANFLVEQGISADCSFIAALSVCLARNARGGRLELDLLTVVSGRKAEAARAHPAELYRVKLYINGDWRSFLIDGSLPRSDRTSIPMHAVISPQLGTASEGGPVPLPLYAALMEKAYLTVMSPNGYAHQGSTPALDLSLLTGWIPEHISLTAPGFRRESTWNQIWDAWQRDQVLLCAGTGRIKTSAIARQGSGRQRRRSSSSSRARRGTQADGSSLAIAQGLGRGLAPLHAYGIVDMWDDLPGVKPRGVKVANPWRTRGMATPGPSSDAFQMNEMSAVLEEEDEADEIKDIFEMSWDELCNRFESLSLAWSPSLFASRLQRHATWKAADSVHGLATEPVRINVNAKSDCEVVVSLQRHIKNPNTGQRDQVMALHMREVAESVSAVSGGSLSSASLAEEEASGEYTNSSFTLRRWRCRPGRTKLLLTPDQEGLPSGTAYTLQILSDAEITLERSSTVLPYGDETTCTFRGRSAGGNVRHPTHMYNPQFKLDVKALPIARRDQRGSVRLILSGPRDIAFNIKAVRNAGERVIDLEPSAVLLNSGAHSHGLAQVQMDDVEVGTYTLIASTFSPGEECDCRLRVESSLPASLTPIPQVGAGLFSRIVRGAWTDETAGGRPSDGQYASNPTMELLVPEPATVSLRLHLLEPGRIPLNLTLFRRGPQAALGPQIATSGPYADATSGVAIPSTRLEPGLYLAVASTYSAGTMAGFQVAVYADRAVEMTVCGR